jgi:hypothetical protein
MSERLLPPDHQERRCVIKLRQPHPEVEHCGGREIWDGSDLLGMNSPRHAARLPSARPLHVDRLPLAESRTRPGHFLHIGPACGTMPGATVKNGCMIFSASGTQEHTSAYPAAYRHASASAITNHRRARYVRRPSVHSPHANPGQGRFGNACGRGDRRPDSHRLPGLGERRYSRVPRVRSSLFRPPRRRRRLRCGFSSMPSCRPHCCGFLRSAARRLLRVVTSDFESAVGQCG